MPTDTRALLAATGPSTVNADVKTNDYRPTTLAALILSPDPLAGALIAAAVELVGVPPAFAAFDESRRAALRRVRPMYVLMHCDDDAVGDDAFLGPAMMTGARLFLFGTERGLKSLETVMSRYELGAIVLPRDVGSLREILTATSESSRHPRESIVP